MRACPHTVYHMQEQGWEYIGGYDVKELYYKYEAEKAKGTN